MAALAQALDLEHVKEQAVCVEQGDIDVADFIRCRIIPFKKRSYEPELQLLAAIVTEAVRDIMRERGKWFWDAYYWLKGDGHRLARALATINSDYMWLPLFVTRALSIADKRAASVNQRSRTAYLAELARDMHIDSNMESEIAAALGRWE